MTGVEFAAALLKIRPDLPIILTTGYSPTLTAERVRALGIRELLLKPQTIQTLSATVQRALNGERVG
jgi:DNA-binding NarL/FixJ family response regulator